jgi:hypothetical protein
MGEGGRGRGEKIKKRGGKEEGNESSWKYRVWKERGGGRGKGKREGRVVGIKLNRVKLGREVEMDGGGEIGRRMGWNQIKGTR